MAGYLGGLTGWSGGGRRPITYGLMPGQMRNTRVNIFQRNYVMPMATCYYAEPPCHCEDSGMPKWMQWTMLGGMGAQLIGGILSGIFGGGSYEGAGGAKRDPLSDKQKSNLTVMRQTYSQDCTISDPTAEGQVCIQGKTKVNGKYQRTWVDVNNLQAKLSELYDTADNDNTETPVVNHKHNQQLVETAVTADPELKEKITYDKNKGKFIVDNKEFDPDKFSDALKAAKGLSTSAEPTDTHGASPSNTGASGLGTYKFQDGDTWYSIVQKYTLPAGTTMRDAIGQLEKLNGLNLNMQQRATNKIGPKQQVSNGNIKIPNEWTLKTT